MIRSFFSFHEVKTYWGDASVPDIRSRDVGYKIGHFFKTFVLGSRDVESPVLIVFKMKE